MSMLFPLKNAITLGMDAMKCTENGEICQMQTIQIITVINYYVQNANVPTIKRLLKCAGESTHCQVSAGGGGVNSVWTAYLHATQQQKQEQK